MDLIEIWQHVAKDNPEAADRLLDNIDAKCLLLIEQPELGPARPDIGPGIRLLFFRSFLILYRIMPRYVEVSRVVHGARDLRHFTN